MIVAAFIYQREVHTEKDTQKSFHQVLSATMDPAAQKPSIPAPQQVHHEARNAENSAAYLLSKLQYMRESNPHLTMLDVGAGSGTISVTLAKAIPDGHVTATDLNKDILPRAQANAESAGVKNIEFQQANVFKLPFPDGTFDITHCHQVLTHLKEPWDALREMLRVTKPGGVVAAREGNYETECFWPDLPGVVKFHNFIGKFLQNPTAGRQLLSWALKAGLERRQVTTSFGTWCYSTSEEKNIWAQAMIERVRGSMASRMRQAGLDTGLTTEDELEEMAKGWKEWEKAEDATLGMLQGEILIQK